ncbi:hypothetical protein [Pseudomonas cavernae]|uniref:hypothetical protein n=1 Tax=Pseudomonas cavernae TaxID=2320867 RepID=UPI0013C50F03|nr:hypothetical protein [Pseudomonas cavernae]
MEKDIYTLIDTALKIGLGALISGSATYFVARHNSSHEKAKEERAFRRQILQQAALKLELAHFKLDEATHPFWAHVANKDATPLTSVHEDSLKHNLDARNIISEARALITLLGILPLRKSLLEIEKDASKIYEAVAKNEVFKQGTKINDIHNDVRRRLGECIETLGNHELA